MLKAIASYYGLEKNVDMAKFFGVTEQTAYMRMKQGILAYEDIYRLCPDISPDWLLSGGEGPMLRAERVENNGNLNIGNNAKQYFRTHESESVKKALEALDNEQKSLAREQEALARSQEQVSGLIQILQQK